MIWFLLLILFLISLVVVFVPLWRYRDDGPPKHNSSKNIDVYKAQLRELETDQNIGVLSPTEAAAARLEIERRLLRITADHDRDNRPGAAKLSPALMMVVITIIMLGATAFYLTIGMPGMPDFALKDQNHSVAAQAEKNIATPEKLTQIAEIKAYLKKNPGDGNALHSLGQNYSALQMRAEAAQAYQRWYQLAPGNISAAVIYGESLVMLSDGRVSPAALLVFNRARKIQPENPGVRHYLALAHYQAGNVEQALADWQSLVRDSTPDAPWLRQIQRWVQRAQTDLGLPVTKSTAIAPALSDEQRKAIEEMSEQEQAQMIRGMVARLARKMDENPENTEGWLRLSRAYMMLDQRDDAVSALERAEKYAPDHLKPQIKKQLEILLK